MGFWVSFAIAIALQVVSYLLMPKPRQPPPAAAEKFDIPTAQEGACIPVLFGTRKIKGSSVTWYGDIRTVPIKSKGGKK